MNEFIKVYPVETHQENFDRLMTTIEHCVERDPQRTHANMSHTDYFGGRVSYTDYKIHAHEIQKPYQPYKSLWRKMISPYIKDYMESFGCDNLRQHNTWFAQYYDGADFGWHTHTGTNLSCVYLLEGTPRDATQFWGFDIKVKEGDLVLFPAMVRHRSPQVNHGRKTIIAQNMDIL